MSSEVKAELSKKNEFYISKHRFYELKHFCLQYPTWKEAYYSLDGLSKSPERIESFGHEHGDPTVRCAQAREAFRARMKIVEDAAEETDHYLKDYILEAVAKGRGYTYLSTVMEIPCSKEYYYKKFREFFYILSKTQNKQYLFWN